MSGKQDRQRQESDMNVWGAMQYKIGVKKYRRMGDIGLQGWDNEGYE